MDINYDENLIIFAQQQAKGTTIHQINGLLGAIYACNDIINHGTKKDKKQAFLELRYWKRVLRYYLETEDYKEARKKAGIYDEIFKLLIYSFLSM